MAHWFFSQRAVAVILWGKPEFSDVQPVLDKLIAAGRRAPRLPILITIVPENAEAPGSDLAKEFARRFGELVDASRSITQVFEGTGFFVGFKRSVLTGMLSASNMLGSKRRVLVCASMEEALAACPPEDQADLAAVLDEVRRARATMTMPPPPPPASKLAGFSR